ncbi:hypothetical protein KSP40_PGU003312 [Platanthera guangdongensis]|uniref:GIY-YIG homing endonuclease n=1 Tax=Platanthera guangdongensis TaxID=2320717 RepID=A0ABR2LTF3_9ASPA
MVSGQLAPNTLAVIFSFISYLRSEKITFSMNIFRKMFSVRSITSFRGRPYKGVIYFYYRGMKVVGLPNKIHNWTSRFLIFEGDLGFVHTYPQEHADSVFKSVQLDAMESAIVKFQADTRLDTKYYIPVLASLADVSREESKLLRTYGLYPQRTMC